MVKIDSFNIIGISVNTSNQEGKAAEDLGKLWEKFYKENIPDLIPNKLNQDIYCIYTDYENDFTGNYTALIGVKVDSLQHIPKGLTGRTIGSGRYQKFIAQGDMPKAVLHTWEKIWEKDAELNRKYTADFEIYSSGILDNAISAVVIYIAV